MGPLTRPLPRIYDRIKGILLPQAEEPTEPLQQTPPDNQAPEPPSEMVQGRPDDRAGASRDNTEGARTSENGRQERHLRTVPGRTTSVHRLARDQPGSRSRLKELEDSYRVLSEKHDSLGSHYRRLFSKYKAATSDLHEAQSICTTQQGEIDSLRERLRSTSTLLEVRNQELKVAKTFLSKEDNLSASDVVQAVCDLNSEIMQTAAHLADSLALSRGHGIPSGNIPEGPYKQIFATLLLPGGSGDEVDAGSLELAFHGFLVGWLFSIANAWGFGQASGWCDELYSRVCETEDPVVASNWRALTHRTLFRIDSSRGDLPRQVVSGAIQQLAFLLSSCGVGEYIGNAQNIHNYAADKFGSLFSTARKLNKMIGEDVVSGDLVVTAIGAGYPFDSEHMEDAYARGGAKRGQRAVICSVGLGLCERSGAKGGKVLLKSKVALREL